MTGATTPFFWPSIRSVSTRGSSRRKRRRRKGRGLTTRGRGPCLRRVLAINFFFFVLEILTGFIAGSMGLVADSLDMLADSIVYGLSLSAVGGTLSRKKKVAGAAGYFQAGPRRAGIRRSDQAVRHARGYPRLQAHDHYLHPRSHGQRGMPLSSPEIEEPGSPHAGEHDLYIQRRDREPGASSPQGSSSISPRRSSPTSWWGRSSSFSWRGGRIGYCSCRSRGRGSGFGGESPDR